MKIEPKVWRDIVGNYELVRVLKWILFQMRFRGLLTGLRLLVYGDSRSGKTACLKLFSKALLCLKLDKVTLDPCNDCEHCKENMHVYGTGNWGGTLLEDPQKPGEWKDSGCDIYFLDSPNLTRETLRPILAELRHEDGYPRVAILDEAHWLHKYGLDQMLLKPMDDYQAIWILSSAVMEKENPNDERKLDKMIQNRCDFKVKTELPSDEELAHWFMRVAVESGFEIEDPVKLLPALFTKAGNVPGQVLKVFKMANSRKSRKVTLQHVEQTVIDIDN